MFDRARWAALVPVVAAVLAGVHAIDASPVGVFYDDALYVILGKALAFGDGYRYVNVPGAPVATHFPPGYPALLAVLWRLSPHFPENLALFKMVNAGLLGVVAFFTYEFARTRLQMRDVLAALTAIASTVTIPALVLSSSVISETLFLALLLPLLTLSEGACERGGAARAVVLGISVGLLCMIRSHAIALIPALAIVYLINRHRREALLASVTGVAILLPWFWWVHRYDPLIPLPLRGQYGSYGTWLAEGLRAHGPILLLAALRDNIATCAAIIARSFSLGRQMAFDVPAVIAVLTLCVAGAIDFAKRAKVTLLFVILYMAVVLVWPFSPLRFVWGIGPIIALMMVSGARYLWRLELPSRGARIARGLSAAATAIALVGAINFNVRGYANAWWATGTRSMQPRIQPQLVWVAERTNATDVIAADDEGAVYLYTGRFAVPNNVFTAAQYFRARTAQENAPKMAQMIRTFAPTYLLAWATPTLQAAAILAAMRPPLLVQVDTIPKGRVFRRVGS